jgi:hypothetical protein
VPDPRLRIGIASAILISGSRSQRCSANAAIVALTLVVLDIE